MTDTTAASGNAAAGKPVRIRVDFTISVPAEHVEKLRDFACADDLNGLRGFIRDEPLQYLLGYLDDNGIPAEVVRRRL